MILKRRFDPRKIIAYVRVELIMSLIWSGSVYVLYDLLDITVIALPIGLLGAYGTALAIFLAFRNNTSFARWGEASQQWSNITSYSRIFARLIITFVDAHRHTPQYNEQTAQRFKQEMLHRHLAWVNALRLQLRGQAEWETLRPYLKDEEFSALMQKANKPGWLMLLQGRRIYDAMASGILQGFDSFQLEGCLAQLANFQAGCERIKTIPVPRQYDYFTRLFVHIFILLLPLLLVRSLAAESLALLVIPVSVLLAFVFAIVEKTGVVNEEPFENRITDVPLSAICRKIERDVKELLAEELPPVLEAKDGYLF
jgi:putative membrane protein